MLILSAAVSGCREKGSESKKAVQNSLQLLNENRVEDFRASLVGQAREQMKSNAAVASLKQKVSDLGEVTFGNENVVDSSTSGGDTTVVNRIEVKRGRDVVGTVDVRCDTDYSSREELVCEDYREPTPRYGGGDSGYTPNPPRYDGRNDGGSSGGSSSDGDRDRDQGYRVPGDSSPKPDPNENRNPDRPPRFPGSSLANMSAVVPEAMRVQNYSSRSCRTETRTSSTTTCKVSQINL